MRVSKCFCEGCGTPGRAPSSEPLCTARSSRSSTCAPRAASACSTRVLALPVAPQITRSVQLRAGRLGLRQHVVPEALVAAGQLLRIPADQAQPGHHRAAAQAAAPAVDQRPPVRRPVGELLAQVARQVGRDHRAADPSGLEGPGLLVKGADDPALLVVEHRAVDGAGDVVERELGRRAGIDQGVEAGSRSVKRAIGLPSNAVTMSPWSKPAACAGPSASSRTPRARRCLSRRRRIGQVISCTPAPMRARRTRPRASSCAATRIAAVG